MSIWTQVLYAAISVTVATLYGLTLGGIVRKLYARVHGRFGPPVWQPFLDIIQTSSRRVSVSHGNMFLLGPVFRLAGGLGTYLFLPVIFGSAGIAAALDCFDKEHNLVIEGNSFLRVQSADVAILVVSPLVDKIKRSARLLLNKIDFIVINTHESHTTQEIEGCKENMLAFGFNVPFYTVNPCLGTNYSNQVFIEKIQDMLFKT